MGMPGPFELIIILVIVILIFVGKRRNHFAHETVQRKTGKQLVIEMKMSGAHCRGKILIHQCFDIGCATRIIQRENFF